MNENLKKLVDAAAEGQAKYNQAMADGTFNIPGDAFLFIGLLMAIPDLYNSGPAMWNELKNGTHPDRAELEAYIKGKDFGTATVEAVITAIADLVTAAVKAIDAVKALLNVPIGGGASDPA